MSVALRWAAFPEAMIAALLPHRLWRSLPCCIPIDDAAFFSGIATLMIAAAIGIPGFLAHAGATTSLANETMIAAEIQPKMDYNRGLVQGLAGLSIFTFVMTPVGLLTLYLAGSGVLRAMSGWFGDPVRDPVLTGLDTVIFGAREKRREQRTHARREALEGPEVADRVVTGAAAGIPECDLVVVSARRKPGWERGVVVFTQAAVYRLGAPVERTMPGCPRTLSPAHAHC